MDISWRWPFIKYSLNHINDKYRKRGKKELNCSTHSAMNAVVSNVWGSFLA